MSSSAVTREQAAALVAEVEDAFTARDVERIVSGYTDDVLIQFADLPEIRGTEAAARFLAARFARQVDYRLRKRVRAVDGNVIGNYWDGTWVDAHTGQAMCGRGTEFWTLRDGKIAIWEATFNVWPAGGGSITPIL